MLAIVGTGLMAACAPEVGVAKQSPTVEAVRTDIAAHVPAGSSPDQVVEFLNQRRYHDGNPATPELSPRVGRPDEFELPAIIRNSGRRGLVRYDIAIRFIFDRNRLLKTVEVKEVGTGP